MSDLPKMRSVRNRDRGNGWVQLLLSRVGLAAANPKTFIKNPKSGGQLPGLYGLRAIAAFMIMMFHFSATVHVPETLSVIKTHFGQGVPLFFALSGFSLMYSTSLYVGRDGWVQIYLIKRFFRIAPLFYVMIIFFTIYNIFVWHLMPDPSTIVINVLFLYNLVPGYHESLVWAGWTLGVEMLFYVMFPILLITITNLRRGLLLFIFSAVAGIAAQILLAAKGQGDYASMSLIVNAPYFIAGIMTFFVFKYLAQFNMNSAFIGVLCTLALAVVIWAIVFNQSIGDYIYAHGFYPVICAVVFGLLCVWQALYPSRILSWASFQFCGERSYSIYLVHAVIIFRLEPVYKYIYSAIGDNSLAFLASAAVALTAAVCVAAITFRLIEMPGIKLGASLIERGQRGIQTAIPRTLPAVSK